MLIVLEQAALGICGSTVRFFIIGIVGLGGHVSMLMNIEY